MTAGPVNRTELEANYQDPGEIYDDTKTEGAFNVIADQIDDNWADYAVVKTALNSTTLGSSGTQYVKSPTIVGVTGSDAYAQLLSLKQQIDAIVSASIPPGSISTAMLQDGSVAFLKLSTDVYDSLATALKLIQRDSNGRAQIAAPSVAADIARLDTVTSYIPVSGSYTGNGTNPRTVTLPFTPSAVFVIQKILSGNLYSGAIIGLAVTGVSGADGKVSVTTNGFTVTADMNFSTQVYTYIAIR